MKFRKNRCVLIILGILCFTTLSFAQIQVAYTVAIEGSGTVQPGVGTLYINMGEYITLSAIASPGYTFSHWSGPFSSSEKDITVMIWGNENFTAHFTKITTSSVEYTISKEGQGTIIPGVGTHSVSPGTSVDLIATPADRYEFSHWEGAFGGANTSIAIYGGETITAVFKPYMPLVYDTKLTITMNGNGLVKYSYTESDNIHHTGTIDKTTSISVEKGARVELKALETYDWYFEHWSDDYSQNADNPITFSASDDIRMQANFAEKVRYTIAQIGQGKTTPPSGSYKVKPGTNIIVRATSSSKDWKFGHWEWKWAKYRENNTFNATINGGETLTASFYPRLTIHTIGEGTVRYSRDGQEYKKAKTENFIPLGSVITMKSSVASKDWRFYRWDGYQSSTSNTIQTTLDAPQEYTSIFHVRLTCLPANGSGRTYPKAGDYYLPLNSTFNIDASANPGWLFTHWDGAAGGVYSRIVMDGPKAVRPNFKKLQGLPVSPSSYVGDTYYEDLINEMLNAASTPLVETYDDSEFPDEMAKIKASTYNCEIILSDCLLSMLYPDYSRQYSLNHFFGYNYFDFILPKVIHHAENVVNWCGAGLNPVDPWDFFFPFLSQAVEITGCASSVSDLEKLFSAQKSSITNSDKVTLYTAEYITYISLIYLFMGDQRPSDKNPAYHFVSSVKKWVNWARELYGNNNIVLKAASAIALYDILHNRDSDYLKVVDKLANHHFTYSGGFAEGTGYLCYVYEQLLPLYYFSSFPGIDFVSDEKINKRVVNSSKWMLNIADENGLIPAIDDAKAGWFWAAPFALLHGQDKYRQYSRLYYNIPQWPGNTASPGKTNIPLMFLTYYPNAGGNSSLKLSRSGVFDEIGKIKFKDNTGKVNATVISESGKLLTSGASHDQQDHGSLSLRRVENDAADALIIDPGYAGFSYRGKEALFKYHNTVLVNGNGVSRNPFYNNGDIVDSFKDRFGNWFTDLSVDLVTQMIDLFNGFYSKHTLPGTRLPNGNKVPKAAGGGTSYVLKQYKGGLHVCIEYDGKYRGDFTDRAVINFNKELFVFDQVHSFEENLSVHFNMPNKSKATQQANQYIGKSRILVNDPNRTHDHGHYVDYGNSKIRLSVFSQDNDHLQSRKKLLSYYDRDYADSIPKGIFQLEVTGIDFLNNNIGSEYSDDYFSFLSVMETRKYDHANKTAFPFKSSYTKAKNTLNDAVTIYREDSKDRTITYVFVNLKNDNSRNRLTIKEINGKHGEFKTDADFGFVVFRSHYRDIRELKLFNVQSSSYRGVTLKLPGSEISEMDVQGTGTDKIILSWKGNQIEQSNSLFKPYVDMSPILHLLLLN